MVTVMVPLAVVVAAIVGDFSCGSSDVCSNGFASVSCCSDHWLVVSVVAPVMVAVMVPVRASAR